MTLAELFSAVNIAGIGLANVGGKLQMCGPAGAITPEIRAGAGEHKETILALLPPLMDESVASTGFDQHSAPQGAPAVSPPADMAWDERKVQRLLKPALQALDLYEYSSDSTVRAKQFAAANAIDECWLKRDQLALGSALERFLKLMQASQELPPGDGMFDPRLQMPAGCPGCEFCIPTGHEPPPRLGEDLASVLQRIRG